MVRRALTSFCTVAMTSHGVVGFAAAPGAPAEDDYPSLTNATVSYILKQTPERFAVTLEQLKVCRGGERVAVVWQGGRHLHDPPPASPIQGWARDPGSRKLGAAQ